MKGQIKCNSTGQDFIVDTFRSESVQIQLGHNVYFLLFRLCVPFNGRRGLSVLPDE